MKMDETMKSGVMIILIIALGTFCLADSSFPGNSGNENELKPGETSMEPDSLRENVESVFRLNCAWCHGGKKPKKNLRLEPGIWEKSIINAPSSERESLKIVDPAEPGKSYLLMKIRGDRSILGDQMPPGFPLNNKEIGIIRQWIYSLAGTKLPASLSKPGPQRPNFWAPKLINLSTTQTLKKKEMMFLISHRYNQAVESGFDSFFGLDSGANIFFGLGCGLTNKLTIGLGRTNLYKEVELWLHWKAVDESKPNKPPLSMAFRIGANLVTRDIAGRKLFDSKNFKLHAQLSISYTLSHRVTFLIVPSISTNTNHWEPDPEETVALGLGFKLNLGSNYGITAEWIPVISGYHEPSHGWGIGIEKKIGKHVFQVFVVNSFGLTTGQYITGGDLKLSEGKFRLGFSIFRMF
jgi:hypothetical protein